MWASIDADGRIVNVGLAQVDGRDTPIARAPFFREIATLGVLADPRAPAGPDNPYAVVPHAALIAAEAAAAAQADAEARAGDYERKVAFVAALRRAGVQPGDARLVAAQARAAAADAAAQAAAKAAVG